ncbi:iron complex transport system permease protein [Thermocatellispora tengchongensis]|uniref:Iron complex transport system permease protein n=1 Tax=Thermocatellispora tengchongensis TaxID=1073253 RepID=A0A840PAS1_9ACTN|nr:iron ABC transporter permease [Thermocatellispora tengchongensis]MBB5134961.1 iron complex transport system permease protein [Thermocatellispora tengchongensis]
MRQSRRIGAVRQGRRIGTVRRDGRSGAVEPDAGIGPVKAGGRIGAVRRSGRSGRIDRSGRIGTGKPGGRSAFAGALVALTALLGVSLIAAVGLGPVAIPFPDVARILLEAGAGAPAGPRQVIVLDIRLPRVLLGAVVGAGLATVGAILQAVLRNPLADPYIIGASSGASLGAVLVMLAGVYPFGALSLPLSAFLGAMAAFALVLGLSRSGGHLAPGRLILAGVAVAALTEAVTSYIVLTTPEKEVRSALFWTLGGLSGTQWRDVGIPALVVLAAAAWAITRASRLNALVLGDEGATSLGVEVNRLRLRMIVVSALVIGTVVAVSGGIGFVALMVPHAVRLVAGGDNRRLIPLSALTGALLLVWVDVGARMLNRPDEIPIGVITAVLGSPFFLMLLVRDGRRGLP